MENMTPATDYEFGEDESSSSRLAQLHRRIVPKQAMTSEELQALVENDELAKLMGSISLELEMEQLKTLESKTVVTSAREKESETEKQEGAKDDINTSSAGDSIVSEKEAKVVQEKDLCEKNERKTSDG